MSKILLDHLEKDDELIEIDLSKGSTNDGSITLTRVLYLISMYSRVFYHSNKTEKIYLTISESIAGNLKDLIFFFILRKKLSDVTIHLHGGSLKSEILKKSTMLARINRSIYHKIGKIVVLGDSHRSIFPSEIQDKVKVVQNCVSESFLIDNKSLIKKHKKKNLLRVLFISSMTSEKGYRTLLDSYNHLSKDIKKYVRFDFAGGFSKIATEREFLIKIRGLNAIQYHGTVNFQEKKELFNEAHVFCLPTKMLEGQPISILEAYASGCTVLTSSKPGINDIFTDKINGLHINENDAKGLSDTIEYIYNNWSFFTESSKRNIKHARKFSTAKYLSNIERIIKD